MGKLSLFGLGWLLLGCSWTHGCGVDVSGSATVETSAAPEGDGGAAAAPQGEQAKEVAEEGGAEPDYGQLHAGRAGASLLGTRAEAATLMLLGGQRVSLSESLGKRPIYLKFWATWCVPCLEQMPHLEAAYKKYGDALDVYAVNLGLNDSVEAVRQVQKDKALTLPLAMDESGELAEQFHVTVTPMHVLIDRTGVIRYVGHHANAELDAALAQLAAKAEPPEGPQATGADEDPRGELSISLTDGATFTLKAHQNQPVALTFLATWTDWYLAETRPEMAKRAIEHATHLEALKTAHPEVLWMSVASPVWTEASDLVEYQKRLNTTGPLGIDETSAWFLRYRVRDLPTTIFFAKGGKEVARGSTPAALDAGLGKLK